MMEEEVYEAEITPDSGNGALNFTLGATIAVAIVFLFLGVGIGQVVTDEIGSNQSVAVSYTHLTLPTILRV